MTKSFLLLSSSIIAALAIGCSPEEENNEGWNSLGRSCGNGHHADFNFNVSGGESLTFAPGADEVTMANYSAGSSVTSTQLVYGWAEGDFDYSVGLNVNQRIEAGSTTVVQQSEGIIILTVDSLGLGVRQYQSSDFTLTMAEAEFETLSFGSERLIHAEGEFAGQFIEILSPSTDARTVSGSFCLHGYAE